MALSVDRWASLWKGGRSVTEQGKVRGDMPPCIYEGEGDNESMGFREFQGQFIAEGWI